MWTLMPIFCSNFDLIINSFFVTSFSIYIMSLFCFNFNLISTSFFVTSFSFYLISFYSLLFYLNLSFLVVFHLYDFTISLVVFYLYNELRHTLKQEMELPTCVFAFSYFVICSLTLVKMGRILFL